MIAAFKDTSPGVKLISLLILILTSMIIFSVIGMLICIPVYHINFLTDPNALNDLDNGNVIASLKVLQVIGTAIGTFIAPVLLFALFFIQGKLSFFHLNKAPRLASIFIVVLLMIAAMPLINWMAELNSRMILPDALSGVEQWMKSSEDQLEKLTKAFLKMNNIGDLVLNLFIIAFLAALGEELLFRGVIQCVLLDWVGNKHKAIWITAILFSAFHMQFYGFLPRMMLGALLGYLYFWSESLWLPIIAHFSNNAMAVVISYLIDKGQFPNEAETVGGDTSDLSLVLISLFLVGGFLLLIYRLESIHSKQISAKERETT